MSVSRADIVREARALVGCKFRPGGSNPLTGIDQWGLLLAVAKRLKLGDQALLARYSAEPANFENIGEQIVFGTIRRCVVARRFGVEIPIKEAQTGDFATRIEPSAPDPKTGIVLGAEPVLIVTSLDPPTFIHVDPARGVVEEQKDFELHKAFRLRIAGIDLDEFSISREQTAMAQDLYMKAMFAKIRF